MLRFGEKVEKTTGLTIQSKAIEDDNHLNLSSPKAKPL